MEREEETREILLPNWQGSGSHGITIAQTDDGVFVRRVQQNSPAARMGVVQEGDQIVSATVYFDKLQSGEAAQLLQSLGQHTLGLRLQRRGDRSPQAAAAPGSPEVMLVSEEEEREEGREDGDRGERGVKATVVRVRMRMEEDEDGGG
ncbi:Neuroblast differentiation-associated protein AHNAK [Lonchura striata]|uniref:Neuroblast differentiation-associated protein AHNAK n=2 Tax=Lonchura striata TaxID=40157 RepID=A0A218U6W8_9PASE|nr:Neuroblast differentiation-associated protein AHNAK [Lonchura striata domestica]